MADLIPAVEDYATIARRTQEIRRVSLAKLYADTAGDGLDALADSFNLKRNLHEADILFRDRIIEKAVRLP